MCELFALPNAPLDLLPFCGLFWLLCNDKLTYNKHFLYGSRFSSKDVSKELDLLFGDHSFERWQICKLQNTRVAAGGGRGVKMLCVNGIHQAWVCLLL